MTDKMGTMFECLHRALENKNLGSVNTDTGAKFRSMGIEPSTSCKAVRRPTTQAGSGVTTITSTKKLKSRMFMSLCYIRD